jgi:2,5-diamino-6-(ribosylamino)-4(3H)-pyrimidinone 5'-phosphate reductase
MMTTLDGKIGSGIDGVDIVEDYMDVYREVDNGIAGSFDTKGNAWLCGRVTSQLYYASGANIPLTLQNMAIKPGDYISTLESGRFFITIDTHGILRWKTNTICFYPEHGNLNLIIIVTESTPKEYLEYLQSKSISYVIAGKQDVDLTIALQKLHKLFHIYTILLEGGGKINGSFLQAGLIDEIHFIILPRVLNKSDAPSVFDSITNPQAVPTQYELLEMKQLARECVFLCYKKKE